MGICPPCHLKIPALRKMLETACVVVSVCVFLQFSNTALVAEGVLYSSFFFFQETRYAFAAGLTFFPFSKLPLFPFFPFSNFEYKSNSSYPDDSSSRRGCLCSSPAPSVPIPLDSDIPRNCLNSSSRYVCVHLTRKARRDSTAL